MHSARTVLEAGQDHPGLAALLERARGSAARLNAVRDVIPEALRPAVEAGPLDATTWCLLLDNGSTAAKLRQLLPAMHERLEAVGMGVEAIRLKVRRGGRG
ncbi:hypothetical protein [Candidatus Symbiobacter mobilis]|uniref:DUF721 domain-containing protein n=1 Tax=Candidatus Symbiobacter mobilis CR TaxID=946483 RepID=U5N9P2_9BURK|nr:hypothetical protein [Candidatus Symbiobacter mobilis]AGX88127.1 hypothetical protein Cenrod_2056 [Candidatus Symbiobacter mobilis CR]